MLLWLSYLFSLYRTRKERVHWVYKKSGYCPCLLAHIIQHIWGLYLHCWSVCFFFIDQLFIFLLSVLFFFFSLGAAIGYLMQIFFIRLHFLYDKGLLLPSSMQSSFFFLFLFFVGLLFRNMHLSITIYLSLSFTLFTSFSFTKHFLFGNWNWAGSNSWHIFIINCIIICT